MQIFEFILALVKLPAIVLGLIALVGLVAQRKPASDVLVGTVKTILGLLIMSVGIGALINALIPIQAMFEKSIPAAGFVSLVTFDEAVVSAVHSSNVAEIAFGHGQTLLKLFCAWAGRLVGKPEDTAEDLKVPEGLNFFRDMAVSISLVLLQGVRMLIAEIVPASKGVAERIIPGAKPALDCLVIYPFAPNSLIIGMIAGTIGQVLGMIALALIGWPVPLPSMIAAFFASGAGAIFGV